MIISIDVGSTGVRAILVNPEGCIVASEYKRIKQFFPNLGWLEHDLNDIWAQCRAVCDGVVDRAGTKISRIKAIAITTQRNTLAVWDRQSGAPLLPAISWSDNRTRELCRILTERDVSGLFRKRAGRELTTTSIGLKLRWIMDADTKFKERLLSQTARWGTLDTWLVWKLTEGGVWATDYSNAATTSIYDLVDRQWSETLMRMLDLPEIPMPDVRPTMGDYGETAKNFIGRSIPIACVVGDQYASLFGQGCITPGMAKCTLGTGGFCIVNIGHKPLPSIEGITTRICWHWDEKTTYGFEGAVLHVGTLLEWLCNKMGFVETLAQTAPIGANSESRGVYIVPAFSGLASPCWDPDAKAIIVGLSLDTGPAQLVRAGLEAVAFQVQDMVEVMQKCLVGQEIKLCMDGNVAMNNTLMQIVADQLQAPVVRSSSSDSRSALGAAFLAGIHTGQWSNLESLATMWKPDQVFYPLKGQRESRQLYQGWQDAVKRSRGHSTG
jgi:glycerol kinase